MGKTIVGGKPGGGVDIADAKWQGYFLTNYNNSTTEPEDYISTQLTMTVPSIPKKVLLFRCPAVFYSYSHDDESALDSHPPNQIYDGGPFYSEEGSPNRYAIMRMKGCTITQSPNSDGSCIITLIVEYKTWTRSVSARYQGMTFQLLALL